MQFYMGDLYPSQNNLFETSTETVPEAKDQTALVDDQKLAQDNPVNVSSSQKKSMWASILIVLCLIIFLAR